MLEETVREKPCNECGEVKPLDQFHMDRSNADGKRGKCKECCHRNSREGRNKGQNAKGADGDGGNRGSGVTVPNLKAVREEMGWSQKDLALLAGCSNSMVCRAEKGENISKTLAVDIIAALAIERRIREGRPPLHDGRDW